jgi:hypothetical protein
VLTPNIATGARFEEHFNKEITHRTPLFEGYTGTLLVERSVCWAHNSKVLGSTPRSAFQNHTSRRDYTQTNNTTWFSPIAALPHTRNSPNLVASQTGLTRHHCSGWQYRHFAYRLFRHGREQHVPRLSRRRSESN